MSIQATSIDTGDALIQVKAVEASGQVRLMVSEAECTYLSPAKAESLARALNHHAKMARGEAHGSVALWDRVRAWADTASTKELREYAAFFPHIEDDSEEAVRSKVARETLAEVGS